MFKWLCLGVAVIFCLVTGWMLNDIRLNIRRSADVVITAGDTINGQLPAIASRVPEVVDKVHKGADVLVQDLPVIIERVEKTSEVMAELADDLRQLKELAGLDRAPRDKGVVAYATSLLNLLETSGMQIGVRKNVGSGLKNTRDAADWVRAERREVLFLVALGRSRQEILQSIVKTKLGFNWYIQKDDGKPMTLLDWLREHHPETAKLQ